MEMAVFVLFALLALISALVVVSHRNPVYSTMSLVVTLFSLAVLFVLLGAPFIATLQVLIYTGAILVLFLFVIMLLNVDSAPSGSPDRRGQRIGALVGAAVFAGTFGMVLWQASRGSDAGPLTEAYVALRGVADLLFDRYLLAFEVIGVLLLVAVIAAAVLARRPPPPSAAEAASPPTDAEPAGTGTGEGSAG